MSELERAESADIQRQSDMHDEAVERLGAWAASAQAAYTVAEKLVQTSFVPAAFKDKPYEACAAILAGSEVGLSPLASLRSFDLINGTAAPRAMTLRAIVQSQGHEVVLEESTATRCRMRGRRRGETEWQRVTWSIDRAKDLRLTSKDNWKSQPQAMLVARATSEICRLIASDAILGIGLSVEEVSDGVEAPTESDTEQTGMRRMSRKKPEPVEEAPAPGITEGQQKRLLAAFNDHGMAEHDARMAKISEITGRTVESSSDLTEAEAAQVIDALEADLQQPFPEDPT
jgi:hypothetical protein